MLYLLLGLFSGYLWVYCYLTTFICHRLKNNLIFNLLKFFFQLFNGAYGSEEENRLEDNLDHVEEMRNRIVEANFKWRQVK